MLNKERVHLLCILPLFVIFSLHFSPISSFLFWPIRSQFEKSQYQGKKYKFLDLKISLHNNDDTVFSYRNTGISSSWKSKSSLLLSKNDNHEKVGGLNEDISSAAKEFVDSRIEDLVAIGLYDPNEIDIDENPEEKMSILEKLEKKYLDDDEEEEEGKESSNYGEEANTEGTELALLKDRPADDSLPLYRQYIEEIKSIKYKPLGWIIKNTFVTIWLLVLCIGFNFLLTELLTPIAKDFYKYNPKVASKEGSLFLHQLISDFKAYLIKIPNRVLHYFKNFDYFKVIEKQEGQFHNPWATK